MTEVLLCVELALLILVSVLSVAILLHLRRQDMKRECANRGLLAPDEVTEAEAEKSRRMDDGVNALMTYSVKLGRGRTSGGEP